MVNSVTIKLEGFKELEEKLKALGPKVARNGLRSANFAGTRVLRDAMKAAAPVRTTQLQSGHAPGLLKASIAAFRRRTPENEAKHAVGFRQLRRKYANTARNRRKKRVGKSYPIDNPAFYARFVEYGSSKWPGGHPFMRSSFLANVNAAIEAVRAGLNKAILREALKRR